MSSTVPAIPGRHRHAPALIALAWAALSASPVQAIGCDELRASITEKMKRGGLARVNIVVADAAERSNGRVVGSCETGTRKLVLAPSGPVTDDEARLAAGQAATSATPAARKPSRKSEVRDDEVLVECFDGKHYTDGPCRR